MDVSKMRDLVMHQEKYNSPSWHFRVSRMSDSQVIAIYHNFLHKGLFDKKKKVKKAQDEENYQFTIFDYIQ